MMRSPFVGHRRYSITHRAVQRLRELVPDRDHEDDESLRDRLDEALGAAEDAGHAVRTLDAMLGEPQTLIPVDAFGDVLYAIIKEDTVVTVLPRGHGEEILHRGQAMQQRLATGQVAIRTLDPVDDRWESPRRRWRKEVHQPVVIERIIRGSGSDPVAPGATEAAPESEHPVPVRDDVVLRLPEPRVLPQDGPVAGTLARALEDGRRRAAVAALREVLGSEDRDAALLPLWNAIASHGIPQSLTIGDLIDAVSSTSRPA
jgi:hypothetical protein